MTKDHKKQYGMENTCPWDALADGLRGVQTRLERVVERLDHHYSLLRDILEHTSPGNGAGGYDLFEDHGWDDDLY